MVIKFNYFYTSTYIIAIIQAILNHLCKLNDLYQGKGSSDATIKFHGDTGDNFKTTQSY